MSFRRGREGTRFLAVRARAHRVKEGLVGFVSHDPFVAGTRDMLRKDAWREEDEEETHGGAGTRVHTREHTEKRGKKENTNVESLCVESIRYAKQSPGLLSN